jgi:hypothetical protein
MNHTDNPQHPIFILIAAIYPCTLYSIVLGLGRLVPTTHVGNKNIICVFQGSNNEINPTFVVAVRSHANAMDMQAQTKYIPEWVLIRLSG